MTKEVMDTGSLVCRYENGIANAYFIPPNEAQETIWVGSFAIALVQREKEILERFRNTMIEICRDMISNAMGLDEPIELQFIDETELKH